MTQGCGRTSGRRLRRWILQSGVYAYIRSHTGNKECGAATFILGRYFVVCGRMNYVIASSTVPLPGVVLLLFQGSGDMTEQITISKYPATPQISRASSSVHTKLRFPGPRHKRTRVVNVARGVMK
jgi:hypothetical protein